MPTCSYSTFGAGVGAGVGAVVGAGVGAVVGDGVGAWVVVVKSHQVFGRCRVDVLTIKSGPPESPWQESFPPEYKI